MCGLKPPDIMGQKGCSPLLKNWNFVTPPNSMSWRGFRPGGDFARMASKHLASAASSGKSAQPTSLISSFPRVGPVCFPLIWSSQKVSSPETGSKQDVFSCNHLAGYPANGLLISFCIHIDIIPNRLQNVETCPTP